MVTSKDCDPGSRDAGIVKDAVEEVKVRSTWTYPHAMVRVNAASYPAAS
jgi:hypothetical protein